MSAGNPSPWVVSARRNNQARIRRAAERDIARARLLLGNPRANTWPAGWWDVILARAKRDADTGWREIGEQLGCGKDAAVARFRRACKAGGLIGPDPSDYQAGRRP